MAVRTATDVGSRSGKPEFVVGAEASVIARTGPAFPEAPAA